MQSSRADINEVLKDENRGSSSLRMGRMSRVLVVFEIALSCGLLVASGLMVKSVTKLNSMDPGFRTKDVFTSRIGFPATYTDTIGAAAVHGAVARRSGGIAGRSRGDDRLEPARHGRSNGGPVMIDGVSYTASRDVPSSRWYAASAGFFETFGVNAARGARHSPRPIGRTRRRWPWSTGHLPTSTSPAGTRSGGAFARAASAAPVPG